MIFVISDTHIPERMTRLPQELLNQIKSDDIVFHVGDFVCWEVFQNLKNLATLHAVSGNMDDTKIRKLLPEKKQLKCKVRKSDCVMDLVLPLD